MFRENWQRFAVISTLYLATLLIVFQFNIPIFRAINGFYSELFQYPMLFLTALADGILVFMVGTLLFEKDNERYIKFIFSLLLTAVIVNTIKHFFPSQRPPQFFAGQDLFIIGDTFSERSFPSGHSAAIMVLARFFTFRQPLYIAIPILLVCILAALSRAYVGVHFPIDILVGGGIGFFLGDFIFRSGDKYRISNSPRFFRIQTLITYPLAILAGIYFIISESKGYEPIDLMLNTLVLLLALYFVVRFVRMIRAK